LVKMLHHRPEYEGTGIGLAEGATFTVFLPA
jgi:hypothetical protein